MDMTADGRRLAGAQPLAGAAPRRTARAEGSASPRPRPRLDGDASAEERGVGQEAADVSMRSHEMSMRPLEFLLASAAIAVAILLGLTH